MFHELLENPKPVEPGVLQSNARKQFPSLLRRSHLEQRVAGSTIPGAGKYIIVGIATYSPHELRLLDEINAAYPQWGKAAKVSVFDLMECKSLIDINQLEPPFAEVVQSPIVAFWDGGKLVASRTGLRATRDVLQSAGVLK